MWNSVTVPRTIFSPGAAMEHNRALDGLRGVALLAVFACHSPFFFRYHFEMVAAYASRVEGGGRGVDLFFVLSGFLITSKLIEMHRDRGCISLKVFFVNRATRLFPALYAMLFVTTVVYVIDGAPFNTITPSLFAAVFYYVTWMSTFGIPIVTWLGHLWSLSLEEQFYVVWPFIMMLAVRTRVRTACIGIALFAVAALAWRIIQYRHNPLLFAFGGTRPDIRFDGPVYGALVAFIVSRYTLSRSLSLFAGVVGGSLVAAHIVFAWVQRPYSAFIGISLFYLAAGLLILSLTTHATWIARFLENRVLTTIGRYSYGAYLWHFPIWLYITGRMRIASPLVQATVCLVVTALATAASWIFIEQPAMRMRPRLLRSQEPTPAPVLADTPYG